MLTVTGAFPIRLKSVYAEYRWNVNNPSLHGPVDKTDLFNQIASTVDAYIVSQSRNFGSNYPAYAWTLAPFGCTTTGSLPAPLPPVIFDFEKSKQNNGSRWRARLRTSDIIVSPYFGGGYINEFSYGQEVIADGSKSQQGWQLWDLNLYPRGTSSGRVVINGWEYSGVQLTVEVRYQRKVLLGHLPSTWNEQGFQRDLLKTIDQMPKDDGIIVTTLAEANSATLDILTAMAEMPETVRSIYAGLTTIGRMYVEARQKSFRLYNKGAGRSKSTTALKNSEEVANAVADVWLNFRYNIMPNVILIEDTLELLSKEFKEFLRVRGTVKQSVPFLNNENMDFSTQDTLEVTHRVMIKRLVTVSESRVSNIMSDMLANVVITGYELIPLSFVLDWIIQIGDFLMAFAVRPDFRQEGATISWKCSSTLNFTGPNDTLVSSEISFYKRLVINPRATVFIPFKPDIAGYRTLDALALSWSIFKDDLLRTPRRL